LLSVATGGGVAPTDRPGLRIQIEPYRLATIAVQPAVDDAGGGDLEGGAAGGVRSVVGDRGHAARVGEVQDVGHLTLDHHVGMEADAALVRTAAGPVDLTFVQVS
jgi:hypothetical protein